MIDQTYNKLMGALIGVARSIDWYAPIEEASIAVIKNTLHILASSQRQLSEEELQKLTKALHMEKLRLVPDCFHCLNRCGRTDDYDMNLLWNAETDVKNAKLQLLDKLFKLSYNEPSTETEHRYMVKALLSLGEAYSSETLQNIIDEK